MEDVEVRRPEGQQACAHLRVVYMTEQIEGGRTRGWWECDLCRAKFVPAASAEYAEAQAIKTTLERCARYVERRNSPFPPSDTDLEIAEALRREPEKMSCSFCGKAVDPEGHRWECLGREPAP